MQQKSAEEPLKSSKADLWAVLRIAEAACGARDLEELARTVLDALRDHFGWVYGAFWQEQDGALRMSFDSGSLSPEFRRATGRVGYRPGEGLPGRAREQGRRVACPDLDELSHDPRAAAATRAGVCSGVALPLLVEGEVAAVLEFLDLEGRPPGEAGRELLDGAARLVAGAMDRLRAFGPGAHPGPCSDREAGERGLQAIAEALDALAAGDLTISLDEAAPAEELVRIHHAVGELIQSLRALSGDIRRSAGRVSVTAAEIARGNTELSKRTEHQAHSLEQTAATMEELTITVRQTALNAEQAANLVQVAWNQSVAGGALAGEARQAMKAIQESSRKIAEIIRVIDEIAFQTNILALNAAVEAARAGDQGRGFAVVATEVRNLAQKSAAAAREIETLITNSVERIGDGSRLVSESTAALENIGASVAQVNDLMADIAAASHEQAIGIEEVNNSVLEMEQVTQHNATLSEEATAAAEFLDAQARKLWGSVEHLRLEGDFDTRILDAVPETIPRPPSPRKVKEQADDDWQKF